MAISYYYASGATRNGPVSFEELRRLVRNGEINRQTKVWSKGMEHWEAASSVANLFDDIPPEILDESPPVIPETETKYGTLKTGVGPIPTGKSLSGWLCIIGAGVFTGWIAIEVFNMPGHVAAPFAAAGCWAGKYIHQKLDA